MIIVDEPLLTRVHRLASPAYRVTPPDIHAPALIPPDILPPLRAIWDAGTIGVRAVDFYRLRDVYVCGEGLVFDAEGQVYRSTIGQHGEDQIEAAAQMVRHARRARAQLGFGGAAVLCKKSTGRGFSDWLLEMLPRAVLARTHLQSSGLRYIISEQAGFLRAAMLEALTLAGIPASHIVEADAAPRFFEDLIVIDGLAEPGRYLSPLAISCLDEVIGPIPAGQAELLYLTRQSATARRLENETDLIPIAERAGYAVFDPTRIPLVQRIGMFKGAHRVAGVLGSGMVHAMYMPMGGDVRLFMPGGSADLLNWFISQIRRHRYAEQRCAALTVTMAIPGTLGHDDTDITITQAAFRRFIGRP